MRPRRYIRHTDLFLVRFWTQDFAGHDGCTQGVMAWHGRVQRVVDGEAREFKDFEALVDTLRAMLLTPSSTPPAAGGARSFAQPEPHTGSDAEQFNEAR